MRFAPVVILSAGNMAGNLASNGEDLNQIFACAIQAVASGAPVGSLKLQASCDDVPSGTGSNPSANVTHWSDIAGTTQAVSASGNYFWNVSDIGFKWIRVVYTFTSGTGTLTITYNGKGA